ncbi:hypothetical protein CCR94_08350 [Rhodoblastus sphagnicola]|uniref:Glycosyl transferase family 1 domain-containing protein n=1 Tax=Rhodoblastus sphagnicola TaxID=333368 RepID=A0A2S6NAM5_9HYPH|nr:glycosyltransferase family 4 protein [Rhodoblastus sphagnicola]MBB4200289.1 glycosyltransferase involved in cell wall biosynthesis [Rhodoblastus sphagnicola]PPQ31673.1 hypothetical protein CCR94_08350 [Rhodoblastus sphagnicola]
MRVLILMGGYWPGHEATGPNQSLRQMCQAMCGTHEFLVLARDRPFGAAAPSAPSGSWIDQGFAKVRYTPVSATGPRDLRQVLRTTPSDVVWMNGFHDREFTLPTLLMRRLGLVPRAPAILSARGELAVGALGLKSPRKTAYQAVARGLRLLRDVWLHAASEEEAADISARAPAARGVFLARNVRRLVDPPLSRQLDAAPDDPLRIVVVGRIARVKNIDFAIRTLAHVKRAVALEIVGPVEETDYWRSCQSLIAQLPPHVRVRLVGAIPNAEIPERVAAADLFFSPTLGENFGHAIFEALSCAVPALISNRTPWKGLEAKTAGWDLPLGDPRLFAERIDALARLPATERLKWRAGARRVAERFVSGSDAVAATARMLEAAVAGAGERRTA